MASTSSDQTGSGNNTPQEDNRGDSISLAQLIGFVIQRTYNELIVLADTIGSQSDMEKKISLSNYTTKTRQLFIRLLALVKWANGFSKVNKSTEAIDLLNKQSQVFIDTADQLARLSRETLVDARLPCLDIQAAIEILTTGTYGRLPMCIKDRIVPHDPITPTEERETLNRLSQVIQHRLVTGALLPQMRNIKIESGRVTIHVHKEFSMCLTVMGDGPDIPWRLLSLEFHTSDRETGSGIALVHPLQVKYMHQLVQLRLADSGNSLVDAYYILHNFCQSLQVEVLYSQTLRLIQDRLSNDIQIDVYRPGKSLKVSYWKELTQSDPNSKPKYLLIIRIDNNDPAKPLEIIDKPPLDNIETEITDRMAGTDQLSMEYLLVRTIKARTEFRLSKLKRDLQNMMKDVECFLSGCPVILSIKFLHPCINSEFLLVTIDTYTGFFQCHVPQYEVPFILEISVALNDNRFRLPALISELRFFITKRRCEKTLEFLPVTTYDKFPIIFEPDHPMAENEKPQVFVRFLKHSSMTLIIEFKEKESSPWEIEYKFNLAVIKRCLVDEPLQENNQMSSFNKNTRKMFYKFHNLMEIDTFVVTHGPGTKIESDLCPKEAERPRCGPLSCAIESRAPQLEPSAYFIPEVAHVVALCDERIPLITLANELTKRNITHQGIQVDANVTALVLRVLQLPSPSSDPDITAASRSLSKRLLGISIRMLTKNSSVHTKNFMVEFEFFGSPLPTNDPKEQGKRRPVYFKLSPITNEVLTDEVDSLLDFWEKMVRLHLIVEGFTEYLKVDKNNLRNMVEIKSYSYSKLIIGYGPGYTYIVEIYSSNKSFKFNFIKSLRTPSINGHSLIKTQLEDHLNRTNNLPQIIQILHETLQPCISINKLTILPHLGIICNKTSIPIQTFTIVPQSTSTIRIFYQATYCLEVQFRENGFVTIRDGAYSRFDSSIVIDELTPIQGLKTFLSKYECQTSIYRHQFMPSDDNPPSPISADTEMPSTSRHQYDSVRHGPAMPPSTSNPYPTSLGPNTSGMIPYLSPSSGSVSLISSMYVQGPAGHSEGNPVLYQYQPAESNRPGPSGVPQPSPAQAGQSLGHAAFNSPASGSKTSTHVYRALPQRSWAGSVPTFLTHQAFDLICTPSIHPSGFPGSGFVAPLERFLGCVYLKRQIQQYIPTVKKFIIVNGTEAGAIYFQINTLQGRFFMNPQHMQSLHIKIQPTPESMSKWMPGEMKILESFFDIKASFVPYKSNPLFAFCNILTTPLKIMKDFIRIMRLDLNTVICLNSYKWLVELYLKMPPSVCPAILPMGLPGFFCRHNKIIFYLSITNVVNHQKGSTTLILPLIYDNALNTTLLFERRDDEPTANMIAVSRHLRRIAEFTKSQECSIFPSVENILLNFELPSGKLVIPQVVAVPSKIRPTQPVINPATRENLPRIADPVQNPGPSGMQNIPVHDVVDESPDKNK